MASNLTSSATTPRAGRPRRARPAVEWRGFALAAGRGAARRGRRRDGALVSSLHGNAWRLHHVGGADQLRRPGLTSDARGLPLYPPGPAVRPAGPTCPMPSSSWRGPPRTRPAFPASRRTPAQNRYAPGSRLSPHQDRNERDYSAPIVSVSPCLPSSCSAATRRGDWPRAPRALPWRRGGPKGGADRLRYHGVLPLKDLPHPRLGSARINFTIRKAG